MITPSPRCTSWRSDRGHLQSRLQLLLLSFEESLYPNERTRMSAETLESHARHLLEPQDGDKDSYNFYVKLVGPGRLSMNLDIIMDVCTRRGCSRCWQMTRT